jgi:hypothetical protein
VVETLKRTALTQRSAIKEHRTFVPTMDFADDRDKSDANESMKQRL